MAFNPSYDTPVNVADYAPAPTMAPMASSPMMFDSPAVAREVAQVQGQIIIAKKFPRDEQMALMKIDRACSRENLANSALYSYSRGGTPVTGASIRLAEAVANGWGNIKYGFEPVDATADETTVRCYAYDMEANTIAERTFKVPHIRYTRKGSTRLEDPRDIYEAVANQASRRVRACILEIIPSDIVEHAVEMCKKTQASKVKITPESIGKLCEAFAGYEVSKIQLEAFIQRNIEAITIDQYLRLRNIFQSLKDGVSRPSDNFKSLEEAMAERGIKTEEVSVEKPAEPAPTMEEPSGPETFEDDSNLPGFNF